MHNLTEKIAAFTKKPKFSQVVKFWVTGFKFSNFQKKIMEYGKCDILYTIRYKKRFILRYKSTLLKLRYKSTLLKYFLVLKYIRRKEERYENKVLLKIKQETSNSSFFLEWNKNSFHKLILYENYWGAHVSILK